MQHQQLLSMVVMNESLLLVPPAKSNEFRQLLEVTEDSWLVIHVQKSNETSKTDASAGHRKSCVNLIDFVSQLSRGLPNINVAMPRTDFERMIGPDCSSIISSIVFHSGSSTANKNGEAFIPDNKGNILPMSLFIKIDDQAVVSIVEWVENIVRSKSLLSGSLKTLSVSTKRHVLEAEMYLR